MGIIKSTLPQHSLLTGTNYAYVDSFQGTYLDVANDISAQDIGKAFFYSAPKWTAQLFELRNRLVSVFGLKTPDKTQDRQALLDNFTCEAGERLGLFKVFDRTEDEVILGEDDRHLDFRISLYKESTNAHDGTKNLTLSTTVTFHNRFGKLYFLPVKPFHRLIVPIMLNGIIHQIENNRNVFA
ncbi:MAG: DUF2867 domain-containing protein [Bacteroidota bacterium]